MYIRSVEIENIKAINQFTMSFPEGKEAGWHVLIGDNGTGKSTIVRSIAAVLVGRNEIEQIRPYWGEWLALASTNGRIHLELLNDIPHIPVSNWFRFRRTDKGSLTTFSCTSGGQSDFNWDNTEPCFSVGFGPFRRFTGGNPEWSKVYQSAPKAGAHLSIFGEDVALTEALEWLKELDRRRLKEKELSGGQASESEQILRGLIQFINGSGLLPNHAQLTGVNLDGYPEFVDANGSTVTITQLSDGYRSILSLTFELLRQLIRVYGTAAVFPAGAESITHFDLPGVVLIDEIDAHLHPTWQPRIGQWFTQYFPKLQFIVTSHSPLVCRACDKGSIWRLAVAGSGQVSGEVTGLENN